MADIKSPEQEQLILKATYKDGKITLDIFSSHTPSLSYIHKILGVKIDKLIIDEEIRSRGESKPLIMAPSQGGIINFIRGNRRPHAG